MIISYKIEKYVEENRQIEIDDDKNVFLKGRSKYTSLRNYFGVWKNDNGVAVVTIIDKNLSYEYYQDKSIDTQKDIIHYLETAKNVDIISKQEFKEQLDKIQEIIKM